MTATRIATQVHGGYGFMEEYPVARFYRDAKVLEIGEGTQRGAAPADRAQPRPSSRVGSKLVATHDHFKDIATAREATLAPTEQAAAKLATQGKLYVRDRLALLFDDGTFVEDGQLANARATGLPADGVVTGRGLVGGRPALVVANDPTVKAGSWGARTVEKIVRITEIALRDELPVFWFIDSAGARITDQVDLFPGRRGAGRIFNNQVALSGKVPQICCLFGPSAAGGAYIPSFCDVVIMVEGNASMYLGSPRMAEMVVGEKVSLEEMGGARMHVSVSGCGDNLAGRRRRGHRAGQDLLLVPARLVAGEAAVVLRRTTRAGVLPRPGTRRGVGGLRHPTTWSRRCSTRIRSSRSSRCSQRNS